MPVQPVERKLAAIFAADIAGYSRLMARDEVATLARLKACRVIIDGLIASRPPFSRPIRPVCTPCRYHRIEPIKEALLAAGYGDIRIDIVRLEKTIPTAAAFARGIVSGNPLVEQIRARGGEPERVMEAAIAAFQREFGPDPGRMPLQAIIFEAVRRQEEGR